MSKVFVTGPDGLLGSNIVRELLTRNYQVKAMVFGNNIPLTLSDLPIEIVSGDITKKEELIDLTKDCDYIINVAANTNVWPSHHASYFITNVDGAQNVLDAAIANGVKRLVHVGSASAFGFGSIESPGDESTPFKSGKYNLDYINSKKQGQELIQDAARQNKVNAVIVCPTFMIGPYDSKPSSGEVILAIANAKLPGIAAGGKNWVYVKDVADATCNALTMGRSGEAYILGGENLSYKKATERIAVALGQQKFPKSAYPNFLIKMAGAGATAMARITNKKPKLSYKMACIACDGHYFSSKKAIQELDLKQTPIEQGVLEAKKWFNDHNYLKQ